MKNRKFSKQDTTVCLGIILYFIAMVAVAVITNGTCDSGDSIIHFLFSKYAFAHPENFLNHWAKPLFVLLSSPFAQFGFTGMKIFNCCVAACTAWFCYKASGAAGYRRAWLAPLLLCFAPGYFIHVFSGLTEPLFALLLTISIYLLFCNRLQSALFVVSFLPFVRSEGLVVICVFVLYLLIARQYRYLPWLLCGHLIYGIAGSFYYQDVLWVFTKIPYAGSSGKYGSGALLHFVVQLNYIIGIPLYILVIAGFIKKTVYPFIEKQGVWGFLIKKETLLVYGLFVAFISAHSLFWYLGIFESMGLKRVLIAIVPVAVLIALQGFNFIADAFKSRFVSTSLSAVFAGWVFLFPFLPNPASINWKRDLSLSEDQVLVESATAAIKKKFPEGVPVYYAHPYLHITLNQDPFDKDFKELGSLYTMQRPVEYIVIWDSWFSTTEKGITLEKLQNDPDLDVVESFEIKEPDKTVRLVVFANKK